LKYALLAVVIPTAIYFGILGLDVAVTGLQTHVLYMHRVRLTWFNDLSFLHNQVTPFSIESADGEKLHTWHVLRLTPYRHQEKELLGQLSGFAHDLSS
jgi:abhydrolase domain-containing protein 12